LFDREAGFEAALGAGEIVSQRVDAGGAGLHASLPDDAVAGGLARRDKTAPQLHPPPEASIKRDAKR
jgi:hypothetical protein